MFFLLALAVGCAHVAGISSPIKMTDDYYITVKTYARDFSLDILAGDKIAFHINYQYYPTLNIDYHNSKGEFVKFYERNTYERIWYSTDNEEYTIYHNGTAFIVTSSFGLNVTVDSPWHMSQVNKIECSMDTVSFVKSHKCNYKD